MVNLIRLHDGPVAGPGLSGGAEPAGPPRRGRVPPGSRRVSHARVTVDVVWSDITKIEADVLLVGHYLGVTPQDITDYRLPTHPLQDVDIKRARDALKNDPFFKVGPFRQAVEQ